MHAGQAPVLLQRKGPHEKCGTETETTGENNVANLDLFDKRGTFTAPSDETLAALTDTERANVAHVGDASRALDAVTAAVESNETELKETRAEIAALEKQVPKQTFNDLIKQQCADTQRRLAGLT